MLQKPELIDLKKNLFVICLNKEEGYKTMYLPSGEAGSGVDDVLKDYGRHQFA